MSMQQTQFVSIALARLRRAVNICCWVLTAALLAQLMVWCVATFLDVRYETLQKIDEPALVVAANDTASRNSTASAARRTETVVASKLAPLKHGVDPNRVLTRYDRILSLTSSMAVGAGALAVLVLLPLVGLATLIGTVTCTVGVERTISAFIWSVVLTLLILPTGDWTPLPWREGALASYAFMCQQIDVAVQGESWGNVTFYARFAAMPLACLVGVAIVGFRFSMGVEAGIAVEDVRLDPELEKEAGNIKATSLHGARTGAALRSMVSGGSAGAAPLAGGSTGLVTKPTPAITQVTAGEAPRRLI